MSWFCFDPIEGDCQTFPTEDEALAHATFLIEQSCDERWDSSVEQIVVGMVTHVPEKSVLAVRSEMSDDDWSAANPADLDVEEIWAYDMVEVES